jgi:uncharacterized membrane protein YcaP (DUF421 family)
MSDPVIPFDLMRLFFGDAPWFFYAEILFRCVVIYGYTLLLLRWVGGRSIAQLSIVEFLLVIALGSAVGDAMFYPEVPLLHALLAITVVIMIAKAIDSMTRRSERLNTLVDGSPVEILRDGVIQVRALSDRGMSTAEIKAFLRIAGHQNLGEVRAAYVEPSGQVSVFPASKARAGLRIEPPAEVSPLGPPKDGRDACCGSCGLLAKGEVPSTCPNCNAAEWTDAT